MLMAGVAPPLDTTGAAPLTDNTPVLQMVIDPAPLVTLIPVPAVKVALVSVLPVLLPISN